MAAVKWKQHTANMAKACKDLHQKGLFTDATLVCGGRQFKTHSALLSASSEFFETILREHPAHIEPWIVVDDVEPAFMEAILNYLYSGVITVDAMKAGNFLQLCAYLRIRGLMNYDVINPDDQGDLEEEKATITSIEVAVPVVMAAEEIPEEPEPEDLLLFLKHTEQRPTRSRQKPVQDIGAEETVPEDDHYEEPIPNHDDSEEMDCTFEISPKRGQRSSRTHVPPQTSSIFTPSSAAEPQSKSRRSADGYTESTLNESMQAVCRGELNLSAASQKFNVPKSVLWRKLQKHGDYNAHPENKRREAAKAALVNGENIQTVSKTYKIPLATLYRDKQKLIEDGILGSQKRSKAELENAMAQAVDACQNGMAQSEAARVFKVSKATLWRKLNALKR